MPAGRTHVPEIRKGDTVLVLTGKDAGKQGTVERVLTNPAALSHVAAQSGGKSQRARRGFWKPASARPDFWVNQKTGKLEVDNVKVHKVPGRRTASGPKSRATPSKAWTSKSLTEREKRPGS